MPLCERVHSVVDEVFGNNAEVVMGKLVQNIHEDVLKVLLLSLPLFLLLPLLLFSSSPSPLSTRRHNVLLRLQRHVDSKLQSFGADKEQSLKNLQLLYERCDPKP